LILARNRVLFSESVTPALISTPVAACELAAPMTLPRFCSHVLAMAATVNVLPVPAGPVAEVVSRRGRPDLADGYLRLVRQPTLLIVGALDTVAIDLNRKAMQELSGEVRLEIVAGASHLFEEPGGARAGRLAGWPGAGSPST
jgi:pimeloyl-ACP methyl ester carboxylesterase